MDEKAFFTVFMAGGLFWALLTGGTLWWGVLTNPLPAIQVDDSPREFPFDQEWDIYGGASRKDFLGCVGCKRLGIGHSILLLGNPHADGDEPFSIWNRDTPYGTPHGRYSACDPAATNPPVMRDESGHIAGYLTLNVSLAGRVSHPWIMERLEYICAPPPYGKP